MDFQTLIVAVIILLALAYVGRRVLRKTQSFSSTKPGCGSDCGCDK